MKRLKENKHMLHVLKNASPKLRKAILNNASPDIIKMICEIAMNILNGNHTISPVIKKRIGGYKKVLRQLSCIKRSTPAKRKILIQSGGGFIPILIGSILSGLIGKFLRSE